MSGAQQVESAKFPLGEDAREAVVGNLRFALQEARTLGKAVSSRWTARPGTLRPAVLARSLREFPWKESAAQVSVVLGQLVSRRQEAAVLLLTELDRSAPAASQRFRTLLPALPWPELDNPQASDPALLILAEFEALEPAKQTATARNVALLWDCFVEEFGGVSGFLVATATEQQDYLEKLDAAARRMEAGRFSAAGYHYVSVVLMKLYVTYLHGRDARDSAIALSDRVARLINDGRAIRAKESKSPIMVVGHGAGTAARSAPEAVTRVEVDQEPSQYATFRIGYVSQPAMRI